LSGQAILLSPGFFSQFFRQSVGNSTLYEKK
jgi:hypothetical protein